MRNRALITDKIEHVEAQMKNLIGHVRRSEPLEVYMTTIRNVEDLLEEIKAMIQREPMSPQEGNGLI